LKNHFENSGNQLPNHPVKGIVTWRSPSNIAFIKYWGKYGVQLPKNASLSMTLSAAYTETTIQYQTTSTKPKREFLFEGKVNTDFSERIWKYIDTLGELFPFLEKVDLIINSKNSFPHSAGIASSASAMSALALCLTDIEKALFNHLSIKQDFLKKASYVARLGSGSAARSVYGGYTIWGQSGLDYIKTNNEFATDINENIHPYFQQLRDAILIIDDGEKKVSSSLGHSLMNNHPYADERLTQANKHIIEITDALVKGKKKEFIKIVESEALSLHALMLSSDPWFVLMKPHTLTILEKIKAYRESTGIFITFTLDAGPNVHLIYHKQDEIAINQFIENELKSFCKQQQVIFDELGKGPQKIT